MENLELIKLAIEAKKNAHVPYSHFKVGAALLTKQEKFLKVQILSVLVME